MKVRVAGGCDPWRSRHVPKSTPEIGLGTYAPRGKSKPPEATIRPNHSPLSHWIIPDMAHTWTTGMYLSAALPCPLRRLIKPPFSPAVLLISSPLLPVPSPVFRPPSPVPRPPFPSSTDNPPATTQPHASNIYQILSSICIEPLTGPGSDHLVAPNTPPDDPHRPRLQTLTGHVRPPPSPPDLVWHSSDLDVSSPSPLHHYRPRIFPATLESPPPTLNASFLVSLVPAGLQDLFVGPRNILSTTRHHGPSRYLHRR